MNETRHGWRSRHETLREAKAPEDVAWIKPELAYPGSVARPLRDLEADDDLAPAALVEAQLCRKGIALQPW